jgi:hypothetical protein
VGDGAMGTRAGRCDASPAIPDTIDATPTDQELIDEGHKLHPFAAIENTQLRHIRGRRQSLKLLFTRHPMPAHTPIPVE